MQPRRFVTERREPGDSPAPLYAWTEAQRAAWGAYVDRVSRQMGLGAWRLTMSWGETPDPDADATTWLNRNADQATMAWDARLTEWPPDEQRSTAVHELLHCVLKRLDHLVDNNQALRDALGVPAYSLLDAVHTEALEHTVQHLTALLAPTLPLPEWPADDAGRAA